jgi:hypothetical protein
VLSEAFRERALLARQLAQSVKDDVLDSLQNFEKSSHVTIKKLANEGRKLERDLRASSDRVLEVSPLGRTITSA